MLSFERSDPEDGKRGDRDPLATVRLRDGPVVRHEDIVIECYYESLILCFYNR